MIGRNLALVPISKVRDSFRCLSFLMFLDYNHKAITIKTVCFGSNANTVDTLNAFHYQIISVKLHLFTTGFLAYSTYSCEGHSFIWMFGWVGRWMDEQIHIYIKIYCCIDPSFDSNVSMFIMHTESFRPYQSDSIHSN